MLNTQFTSHFIGLKLKENAFLKLFLQLKKYISENSLQKALYLVDPQTLHITLYYLDKSLSPREIFFIKNFLESHQEIFFISIGALRFFSEKKILKVGYIPLLNNQNFSALNHILKENIVHNHIIDNSFDSIFHCTLFRIQNPTLFMKHQENIEKIINIFVSEKNKVLVEGMYLYGVDSTFHPEKYYIYNLEEIIINQ